MDGKADDAGINIRALIFALLALACGHMLSTLLRTIPAISLDVMAADFATPPQTLGASPRSIILRLPPRRFRSAQRWIVLACARCP
jgi:hypothetical protein